MFSPKAEIVVEVLLSMQMLPLYQFFPAVVVGSHPIQKDKNIREPQGRDSGDEFWLLLPGVNILAFKPTMVGEKFPEIRG